MTSTAFYSTLLSCGGVIAVVVPRCGRGGALAPKSWLGPKFSRPQVVARPPYLALLLTHCGQLILRKISTFDAIRCQILRLKCTIFDSRWGFVPDTAGGAYSALPDLLAVF